MAKRDREDTPMDVICRALGATSRLAARAGAGDIGVELDECIEQLEAFDKPAKKEKTEES